MHYRSGLPPLALVPMVVPSHEAAIPLSPQFWGQWFALCPHLVANPRIVDFSICLAFSLFLEWNGDF